MLKTNNVVTNLVQ